MFCTASMQFYSFILNGGTVFELPDMDKIMRFVKMKICEILFIAVFCSYIIANEDLKIEIMIKHAVLFIG